MIWRILIYIVVPTVTLYANNPQAIAADSVGLIVTLKEKYGGYYTDTATVVMIRDGAIWLTHKSFPTTVYSLTNWAVITIMRPNGRGAGTDGRDRAVADSVDGMVSGGSGRRDVEYVEGGGKK